MQKQGRNAQNLTRDVVWALFHLKDEGKPVTLDNVVSSVKEISPGRPYRASQISRIIESDYSLSQTFRELGTSH